MIVMKFGGQALATADRIKHVARIIGSVGPKRCVVVVSALADVTDELEKIAEVASTSSFDKTTTNWKKKLRSLQLKHQRILDELGLDRFLLNPLWRELELTLRGISLLKELTPRTRDFVLSFGERFSARLIAAYLNKQQILSVPLDAFNIGLITDSNFGNAQPLPKSASLIRRHLRSIKKLPVITGFIGKNENGEITTLGRDGSDYTASFIGAALNAQEIQIWRTADGILSADPRLVKNAHLVRYITLEEASELAYYGEGVFHPYMLKPAVEKHIPVRILNIYKPEAEGTLITNKKYQTEKKPKVIVSKENICLVNIISPEIFHHRGLVNRVFDIINRHGLFIHILASSEISLSFVTPAVTAALQNCLAEISTFAQTRCLKNKAIIGLIGEAIKQHPEILVDIFDLLRKLSIKVELISHNTLRTNFTIVVDNSVVCRVVPLLHKKFFDR